MIKNIEERKKELKDYLDKDWKNVSDHFIERLLAKVEYDSLIEKIKCQTK